MLFVWTGKQRIVRVLGKMKILIFLLMLFLVSGLVLINNHNLHLSDKEELQSFSDLYFNWVGQVYSNFFSMTGHFTRLDWAPK